jgi:oligopeptide/dipeptide ABC transporter ATP-binding protein
MMEEADRGRGGPAPILSVSGLTVSFEGDDGPLPVVLDLSFAAGAGEILGLVGESGSGKSVSCMAIAGLLGAAAEVAGDVRFDDIQLVGLTPEAFRPLRGKRIAMVFQDAVGSLNPIQTIGTQLREIIRLHRPEARADDLARDLLGQVGIADVERSLASYPHMLSGGMNQRVMIASALVGNPDLLIADEPTTALDVTTQAQILDLLVEKQREYGVTMLIVTHDLGVVARVCDTVAVMYAGRIVEKAPVELFLEQPAHPYSAALIAAMPGLSGSDGKMRSIEGTVPPPSTWGTGCTFAPRCPRATGLCRAQVPATTMIGAQSFACHHPLPGDGRVAG